MKQMKECIAKHPVMFSILLMAGAIALTFIPITALFTGFMDETAADFLAGFLEQTGVSILLIVLMHQLGMLNKAGFSGKIEKIWLIWPGILFLLFNANGWISGEIVIDQNYPIRIILYMLLYLSTGLFEELLCRGLVLNVMMEKWGMTKNGCYLAVLLSSILFGCFHFVHFFLGHMSFIAAMAQVVYSMFIGVFMCAIFIRNKSIYPAIILHGLIDIVGDLRTIAVGGGINKSYITMDFLSAVICVIIVLPLFIYGLWILRKEFGNKGEIASEAKLADC